MKTFAKWIGYIICIAVGVIALPVIAYLVDSSDTTVSIIAATPIVLPIALRLILGIIIVACTLILTRLFLIDIAETRMGNAGNKKPLVWEGVWIVFGIICALTVFFNT